MNPIGSFHSSAIHKAQAPRQGVFEENRDGHVQLLSGMNFEQALRDLDGFERIWLIYLFDRNPNWRPTARPPVPPPHADRVGVFASRSPYRPNPIGISCVRLLSIQGLCIAVSEADLLDGTPILDIKPYIPAFDAFPSASAGWLDSQHRQEYSLDASPLFTQQSQWVAQYTGLDLQAFAQVQLSVNPFDDSRKRLRGDPSAATLSHRTWRILFHANSERLCLTLDSVASGYAEKDLHDPADPYGDKAIHQMFSLKWP